MSNNKTAGHQTPTADDTKAGAGITQPLGVATKQPPLAQLLAIRKMGHQPTLSQNGTKGRLWWSPTPITPCALYAIVTSTHSVLLYNFLQPASKRNGKTSTCCQIPRIFFRYSIAALQQWAHFETLMAQLIIRAGLCKRPLATCQLTSSRSLPMAAGIYPGPRWTGTCASEGHVFLWCMIITGLSRRSMRHQEAIDERLIKGIDADWHVYLRIIKGRQNESSRFGGARLMKR